MNKNERPVHVGDYVIWVDPVSKQHKALVTAVWGSGSLDCINVVLVSSDDSKTDSYGRQIERQTSCLHKSNYEVHGNYWMWPDETANPIAQPVES